mgnify:CR=1 FL=1
MDELEDIIYHYTAILVPMGTKGCQIQNEKRCTETITVLPYNIYKSGRNLNSGLKTLPLDNKIPEARFKTAGVDNFRCLASMCSPYTIASVW